DDNLEVVAGHGRLAAANQLGFLKVPTIQLGHLTRDQVRAFRLADNRLGENSEWDQSLLREQIQLLNDAELAFSLEHLGCALEEIDLFLEEDAAPNDAQKE